MYTSRDQYRRGRGRGWNRGRHPRTSAPARLPMPDTTQRCLKIIPLPVLRDHDDNPEQLQVKNVRYIASYNWIEKNSSTILVPGKPPRWLPPATPERLNEDNAETHGPYYRDLNAAKYPSYPVEPALRAIYELNNDFDGSSIDIFGCGNTFGSILSFVRSEDRTFRFGVERVGETVFLVRKTNTPKELIEGVYGYGHSFPEAYTTWDPVVKGSQSHQRIMGYNFGGFRCLVRSECDGYLPDKQEAVTTIAADDGDAQVPSEHEGVSLEDAFSVFHQTHTTDDHSSKLSIRKSGDEVAQAAVFDLKTRSIRRKNDIDMSEFLARLWVNRTPNLVLAWHTAGTFHDIEIKDVRDDMTRWELSNQTLMAQFRAVLADLVNISQTHSTYEVRRTGSGDLEIWNELAGWSALPSELKARWMGQKAKSSEDKK